MTHRAKLASILALVSVHAGCSGTNEQRGWTLVGKCSDGSALPTVTDSVQAVTFTLRNTSSSTRYTATAGFQCSTFAIQRVGASESLILDMGQERIGSCQASTCDQTYPDPSAVLAVEPGGTYSFEWDARSYASCASPIGECPDKTLLVTAKQPVAPGTYRVSVPIADAIPAGCSATSEAGRYTCAPGGLTGCGPETCKMQSSASAEFTLPASGNIQVDVPLT